MNNLIFYFSGTGNSLAVAKQIAKTLEDTEVCAIRKTTALPTGNYRRVGVVFPCYASGLPRLVEQYMENLSFENFQADYFFSVETYGGTPISTSNGRIDQILRGKGQQLSYGARIKMFSNDLFIYPMGKNTKQKAMEAAERAQGIAEEVKAYVKMGPFRIPRLMSLVHSSFVKKIPETSLSFQVSDACISCGQCAKLCPASNIRLEEEKPVFGDHCEQCTACIQWCPKEAINYKDETQKRGRYHHPEISADELKG